MQYNDEVLDALRLEGDSLADSVVTELLEGQKVVEVNRILNNFETNTQDIPENLPTVVKEYLQATTNLPAWVDYERIKRAHAFFLTDGLNVAAVLAMGALVRCYAVPTGAKLLSTTHRLNQPKRRVAETSQFCIYMMDEKAFGEGSKFIPSIQKVRLIHAAVRQLINNRGNWPKEYGVPICQEDLLVALMLFSTKVVEGFHNLNIPITQQEAEDYYYVWRIAGTMLGIREDIIPETLEEANALNEILYRRNFGPSPEGTELTRDLIDMYHDLMLPPKPRFIPEKLLPPKPLAGLLPAIVRLMVQDEIADWMEVPPSNWQAVAKIMNQLGKATITTKDNNFLVQQVLDRMAALIIEGELHVLSNGKKVSYEIPPALTSHWKQQQAVAEK